VGEPDGDVEPLVRGLEELTTAEENEALPGSASLEENAPLEHIHGTSAAEAQPSAKGEAKEAFASILPTV
jgi:hypothetical protein